MDFVYRWCTDYTPDEAKCESEARPRRQLRWTARGVMDDGLEEAKQGWFWSEHGVRLLPPNWRHSDSAGSHRRERRRPRCRREHYLGHVERPGLLGLCSRLHHDRFVAVGRPRPTCGDCKRRLLGTLGKILDVHMRSCSLARTWE